MSAITYLDNEYATLLYLPDKGMIHHTFKQPSSGDTFRAIVDQGVEVLKEHQIERWLSDDRKGGPFNEDDIRWGVEDWLPRAQAAGWRYWALIVPDAIQARVDMFEFIKVFAEKGVRIMVFSKLEEGFEWLESVGKDQA